MSRDGGQPAREVGATHLLERERELDALDRAVAGALARRAALVVVEGPAGIGKSRLLAEARSRASERGVLVLSARGGELERGFPFGVVRQLYEGHLADDALSARVLADAAGSAATVFGPADERVDSDGSVESTFAVLHGLFWLTVNMSAETPLLLSVDDLHWCDSASLRFLAYLARRLDDLPVVLAVSLRPAEPAADQALLAELTSDPHAQVLLPGLLSAQAASAVVRDRLGDGVEQAFADACHASTRGNPLLLSELLKAIVADRVTPDAAHVHVVAELGPRAASRAVLLRLVRLSADAGKVARAVAVLGDRAELDVVAALAGLDAEEVAAAARELVGAEILRPEPPLGFVHPLVQAAVYRDLAPGERELHHEQAARLLVERGAPVEQIAAHVLSMPARGDARVVDVLRRAAAAALAKGAPDAAVSSLRRAIAEGPTPELRPRLLLELGSAEVMTSLPDAAADLRAAYESSSDPVLRAHAADGLARTLVFMETPEDAAAFALRAAGELPAELDDLGRRLEAMELVSIFFGTPDDGAKRERLRAHRTIDVTAGVGAKMLAAVAAWEWAESAGPADRVIALARDALAGGELMAADSGLLTVVAMIPFALADLDEAVENWDVLRAEAHRSGSDFTIAGVQLWGGYTQLLRGELDEAEAELRASLDMLALWGIPSQSQWTLAFLAEVLVERGAVAEARAIIDAAVQPPEGSDQAILLDRAQMRVLLAEGRAADALEHAAHYERRARWKCHPRYVPWRSLKAQALDRLGRRDEAVALAGDELGIAREWGSPGTVGRALRVLGTIEREEGIEQLEEACALLEAAPARLEHAKALAALGSVLRRGRRPTDAREPLRRALELAEVCGAAALADTVRAEIYATGARPRTTALQGVGALTASERRVADLAAGGASNRDIAQALYVTPKTVEVHLTSAYRKLGIAGRRELERALAADA